MKVFVVYECTIIEYEECVRVMGVFSSEEKAESARREYENWSKGSKWRHEYYHEDFDVDELWEGRV